MCVIILLWSRIRDGPSCPGLHVATMTQRNSQDVETVSAAGDNTINLSFLSVFAYLMSFIGAFCCHRQTHYCVHNVKYFVGFLPYQH